jgi:dihydropyrimidinase
VIPTDLVVTGGSVVLESQLLEADVVITGGRVSALTARGSPVGRDVETIDAGGLLVLPGAVDVHTHIALPFGEYFTLDDFSSATRAAVLGGTTTVLEFAIPQDEETPKDAVDRRLEQARGAAHIDYGFHACLVRSADEVSLGQLPSLAGDGITSVKVFTAYRDVVMLELDDIGAVMETAARCGSLVMVHAETETIIEESISDLRSQGRLDPANMPAARPSAAELDAAQSVLDLAARTGASVYLVHVTLPEVADAIAAARSRGVAAFGESCPHYLLLDESFYEAANPELFVCSPPLRPAPAVAGLWSYLGNELVGVHSDHCCFDSAQKGRHADDLTRIPPGLPGIQTRFPLMLSEALDGRLSLPDLVSLLATEPARTFSIPRKGALLPGYDADLVVVDPTGTTEVHGGMAMETDYSPFEGRRLRGQIRDVVSKGRVLVRDGEWTDLTASGSFLPRGRAPGDSRAPAEISVAN